MPTQKRTASTFFFVRLRIFETSGLLAIIGSAYGAGIVLSLLGGFFDRWVIDPGTILATAVLPFLAVLGPRALARLVYLFELENELGWPRFSQAIRVHVEVGGTLRELFSSDEGFARFRDDAHSLLRRRDLRWTWLAVWWSGLALYGAGFNLRALETCSFGSPLVTRICPANEFVIANGIFGAILWTVVLFVAAEVGFVLVVFCWSIGRRLYSVHRGDTWLGGMVTPTESPVHASLGQGLHSYSKFWLAADGASDVGRVLAQPVGVLVAAYAVVYWGFRLHFDPGDAYSVAAPLVLGGFAFAFYYLPTSGVHRLMREARTTLTSMPWPGSVTHLRYPLFRRRGRLRMVRSSWIQYDRCRHGQRRLPQDDR